MINKILNLKQSYFLLFVIIWHLFASYEKYKFTNSDILWAIIISAYCICKTIEDKNHEN